MLWFIILPTNKVNFDTVLIIPSSFCKMKCLIREPFLISSNSSQIVTSSVSNIQLRKLGIHLYQLLVISTSPHQCLEYLLGLWQWIAWTSWWSSRFWNKFYDNMRYPWENWTGYTISMIVLIIRNFTNIETLTNDIDFLTFANIFVITTLVIVVTWRAILKRDLLIRSKQRAILILLSMT